jgi:hypothetical protein
MTATAPMPGLHGREAETGVLGRSSRAQLAAEVIRQPGRG